MGVKAPGFNVLREINPLTADWGNLIDVIIVILGSIGLIFGEGSLMTSLYTLYILEKGIVE